MKSETDGKNLIVMTSQSGITGWAPIAIVLAIVGGFVMLSWYAYHAGIQSVKEEDLVVVEADKTPMKEKPADPGGMQFPNQDKTVFETFSGNSHQPAKVERVLPVPEEPMPKDTDASDTTTWVNDKVKKTVGTEQVIGKEIAKKNMAIAMAASDAKPTYAAMDAAKGPADNQEPNHEVIATPADDAQSVTYVAPKKVTTNVADKLAKPFSPEKATTVHEDKPSPPKPVAAENGDSMVQLGAYRSEAEAKDNWNKMHLKLKELSDKKPLVVKADLGEKGVYYRLRIGGFALAEAKALCKTLTAKGQACIIPTGN